MDLSELSELIQPNIVSLYLQAVHYLHWYFTVELVQLGLPLCSSEVSERQQ